MVYEKIPRQARDDILPVIPNEVRNLGRKGRSVIKMDLKRIRKMAISLAIAAFLALGGSAA